MHDRRRDVGGTNPGTASSGSDAGADTVERVGRCGERLVDDDVAARCVDENDVGERATDVDGESPVGASRGISTRVPFARDAVAASWASRKSARGGENTSRIQHSSYSASPMKTESPCQIDAGARYTSPSRSTVRCSVSRCADPEVESAAHDDAELFVGFVLMHERTSRATGDAPEAELQVIAGDDPASETGRGRSRRTAASSKKWQYWFAS